MAQRDEPQKRFFEADPPRLATRVFGNPRYPRNMRKKVRFIAERLAGCRRVLEVGTGRGLQLRFLLDLLPASLQYAGIDLAHRPLAGVGQLLRRDEQERVVLANAEAGALPFAGESFDGVFCLDVLHHVGSQPAMLAEVFRVLRPGGSVICVEPNPAYPVNLIYWHDPIERKLFELTEANVRRWTGAAGLADVRLTNVPVFFPSFPAFLSAAYDGAERWFDRIPIVRRLSTTRVILARRPNP